MRTHVCKARQFGSDMHCAECNLTWEYGDEDPPDCRKVDRRTREGTKTVRFERQMQREGRPLVLPDALPVEVIKAMQKAAGSGRVVPSEEAIRRAYRVMRDMLEV